MNELNDINEYAKKFRLSVERDAFIKGVRMGFQLASERHLSYLREFEKIRTNSAIVINNNESVRFVKMNEETTRVKIGQQLRALRQERSLSTRQLAELTGIGQSHIVRIEAGKYNVGIDTLEKLILALGAELNIK